MADTFGARLLVSRACAPREQFEFHRLQLFQVEIRLVISQIRYYELTSLATATALVGI